MMQLAQEITSCTICGLLEVEPSSQTLQNPAFYAHTCMHMQMCLYSSMKTSVSRDSCPANINAVETLNLCHRFIYRKTH